MCCFKYLKIVFLFYLMIGDAYAQSSSLYNIFILETDLDKEERRERSFIRSLWGDKVENSVTSLPFGYHTDRDRHAGEPFVHPVWCTSVSIHSFEISGFKNSFGDFSLGLYYKRKIVFTKRLSINYGAGIIYGYDGRLKDVEGIPFRETFLVTGPINPVVGMSFDYRVTNNFSFHITGAPQIIIYGVRYRLGKI